MAEWFVLSGIPKGIDKDKYEKTQKYLDYLSGKAQLHYGGFFGDEGADWTVLKPLKDRFDALEKQVEALSKDISAAREEWQQRHGVRQKLDDETQVLGLLPPHRQTAEPTYNVGDRVKWRIAFKSNVLPAHAHFVGEDERQLMYRRSKDNATFSPSMLKEHDRMNALLEPLESRGFSVHFRVVKVSKTNIIAEVSLSTRY